MKQEYSTLLKSPKWQKKRLEILERDNWTCRHCGDTESELHVHHKYYEKDKNPWDYDDFCLITLCGSCHDREHNPYPPKVGDLFFFDHSDFTNHHIVYAVEGDLIRTLGCDNGAYGSTYFYDFTIESFYKRCTVSKEAIMHDGDYYNKQNFYISLNNVKNGNISSIFDMPKDAYYNDIMSTINKFLTDNPYDCVE